MLTHSKLKENWIDLTDTLLFNLHFGKMSEYSVNKWSLLFDADIFSWRIGAKIVVVVENATGFDRRQVKSSFVIYFFLEFQLDFGLYSETPC